MQPEQVEVPELLERTRQRFTDRAGEQDREIRVDAPEVGSVSVDPLRARQALGNLVDNALRHGGGEIRLSARRSREEIEIDVSDEGPGFPAELAAARLRALHERRRRAHPKRSGARTGDRAGDRRGARRDRDDRRLRLREDHRPAALSARRARPNRPRPLSAGSQPRSVKRAPQARPGGRFRCRSSTSSPAIQKAFAIAATALVAALVAALALGACGGDGADANASAAPETIPQPSQAELAAANLDKLPVAPDSKRVDIAAPTFSNPTEITNPLFPISDLQSVIFSGKVESKPFHTETTLLPETRMVEWSEGQWVEARVSQYMAYIDGRIEEVALDFYAQADDGSVWYLGEDVFDYSGTKGLIDATAAGTWLAGRDGPAEMIMPADPQVGDAHRPENIPGIAFEEVVIKRINKTLPRSRGPGRGRDGRP